jgi:hypothetical protein
MEQFFIVGSKVSNTNPAKQKYNKISGYTSKAPLVTLAIQGWQDFENNFKHCLSATKLSQWTEIFTKLGEFHF